MSFFHDKDNGGGENIKINKFISLIILLTTAFVLVCAIPTAFAGNSIGSTEFEVTDESADIFTQLGADKNVFSIEKSKIPSQYKEYENSTFQVAKGSAISYRALINTAGDGMVGNLKGTKVNSATIDFGDGTKKSGTSWISHTYKKTGWYIIKVSLNGSCTGFDNYLSGNKSITGTGKIVNGTKYYLVYVANKPQLTLSGISAGYTNKKDYKNGNINFLTVKVSNVGSVSSKATKITVFYQDPKKLGKVNPTLKKFTVSANLKALAPAGKKGSSVSVKINFKIPKKYAGLIKNIRLDSANKNNNQISKANNLYFFK